MHAIIVNQGLWARFEKRFFDKDTLVGRFNQLAQLRNSILHSRSVGDVTRKDGEAAILWFGQVLSKRAPEQSLAQPTAS